MRYPASEKLEIIRIVEQTHLPAKHTLGRLLSSTNDEVLFCDQDRKGYSIVTLTAEAALTSHVAVSTVTERVFESSVIVQHRTLAGMEFGPLLKA